MTFKGTFLCGHMITAHWHLLALQTAIFFLFVPSQNVVELVYCNDVNTLKSTWPSVNMKIPRLKLLALFGILQLLFSHILFLPVDAQ